MENNQNKTSQPQGKTNQSTTGSTASTPGSSSSQFSQGSSNNSQNDSSNSSHKGASSLGGLNMSNLTQQLQKYSGPIMNKVNGLSTTQKVIGGTLLAAGAGWLAMNSKNKKNSVNNINRTPRKKY